MCTAAGLEALADVRQCWPLRRLRAGAGLFPQAPDQEFPRGRWLNALQERVQVLGSIGQRSTLAAEAVGRARWDEEASPVFSPSLVPFVGHPLVKALGPGQRDFLLARHTLRYLDFTTKLEHLVVNQSALAIAHGACGVGVPEEMRLDAYRIYCDEGYHALFSADLAAQIVQRTGVSQALEEPYFLGALGRLCERELPEHRSLVRMLFVIVSETLITASLAESARGAEMDPGLRATLQDHASDEGRHHVYFAAYLRRLWDQIETQERDLAGRLLPDLLSAFLHPDLTGIEGDLHLAGLTEEEAATVLAEVYSPEVIRDHLDSSSVKTIAYFRQLGAVGDVTGEERLAAIGVGPGE